MSEDHNTGTPFETQHSQQINTSGHTDQAYSIGDEEYEHRPHNQRPEVPYLVEREQILIEVTFVVEFQNQEH